MGRNLIKFIQNNDHKTPKAMSVLRKVLVEDKIDILFLQEPHINKRGMINGLPTGSMVFKCDSNSCARSGNPLWGVFVYVL